MGVMDVVMKDRTEIFLRPDVDMRSENWRKTVYEMVMKLVRCRFFEKSLPQHWNVR